MKPFRISHEPGPVERVSWRKLEQHVNEEIPAGIAAVAGVVVTHNLQGAGAGVDQVVKHTLGRIPEAVHIISTRPIDGMTPFNVWEVEPPKRSRQSIVLRSDTANSGDIVVVRLT